MRKLITGIATDIRTAFIAVPISYLGGKMIDWVATGTHVSAWVQSAFIYLDMVPNYLVPSFLVGYITAVIVRGGFWSEPKFDRISYLKNKLSEIETWGPDDRRAQEAGKKIAQHVSAFTGEKRLHNLLRNLSDPKEYAGYMWDQLDETCNRDHISHFAVVDNARKAKSMLHKRKRTRLKYGSNG